MSNCRADLSLDVFKVNLRNRDEMISDFCSILMRDNDLFENGEEYYRDDTLEKGYDSELDRLVSEATDGKTFDTLETYEKVFLQVLSGLTNQEFFGDSLHEIIVVSKTKLIVCYAMGGYNKY